MAFHNIFGQRGEQMAAELLKDKGYAIIERNWKYKKLEVDIIATNKKEIVFVEVKTRSSDLWTSPEEAVDLDKQCNLTVAANAYILSHHINLQPRFDVIAIVSNASKQQITHIENAFPPMSRSWEQKRRRNRY